jgi:hypothetical protein
MVLMPPPDAPRNPAMVLLAALVGFPHLGPVLLTHLHHTAAQRPPPTWSEFVKGLSPRLSEHWSNAADSRMTRVEAESWQAVAAALTNIIDDATKAGISLPQEISVWAQWVVPVGRLSFPAGRVVTGLLRYPGGLIRQQNTAAVDPPKNASG